MSKPVALVTGAGGEMGSQLLPTLAARGFDVVAVDLAPLPAELRARCVEAAELDILDAEGLHALLRRHAPERVFHLAAVLSSKAERDPERAHAVNVGGTLALFRLCRDAGRPVRFLFPSSIAVYGLPDPQTKADQGALKEWQWTSPSGIYGCNKLYCELVGAYLARRDAAAFDFRTIRFPGLISADTLPSSGTTDFAPEMIHAAAQGKPYRCFVSEETRLPFMTMPDAIEALLALADVARERVSARAYNIKGFSCSAVELHRELRRHFPEAEIRFEPVAAKQAIVDSWPADVDDSRARRDWGLAPRHGLSEALRDYLVPALRRRYAATTPSAGRGQTTQT